MIMGFAGFGEVIGFAFWVALVFGFLLLVCMIATAAIVVLYGLRVATYATATGVLTAIVGVVFVWTIIGAGGLPLIAACVVAFLIGIGGGYLQWGSGAQGTLVKGRIYRILLIVVSLAGVGSGFLFWGFLLVTVGNSIIEVLFDNPGSALVLIAITLGPVVTGGYVIRKLVFDNTSRSQKPAFP